jgi:hypothetical protein
MPTFDPVGPQMFEAAPGGPWDTSGVRTPTPADVEAAAKAMGFDCEVTLGADGRLAMATRHLTLGTVLETKRNGNITVREALPLLPSISRGKLRCQTPFRESTSYAAFLSLGGTGKPFVYDSGTCITHWLTDDGWAQLCFLHGDGATSPTPAPNGTVGIPTTADPNPVAGLASPYPPPFRGVMHEVVQAALAGSTKPQLDLCILSALIGMAASCSGNYRLPSGMRLNLFGCGVAGTGEGKDRPRSIAMSLVVAAKGKLIGKPASGPGLEDSLVSTTGSLIALDEIAHFFAAINNSKAPPHLIELAGTLLQLFSVSNGTYHQRVLAAASRTRPSQPIQNPVVSLLGFATPEKLGEAMGVSNIEDGLLGRFLFAFGQTGIVPRRIEDSLGLPETVRRSADSLNQSDKQASFTADLQGHRDPIQIDPAAETRLGELLVEFDQQRQTSASAFAKALLTRSCEKCERVAGVLAVWDCPAKPVITLEHVTWAAHLLHASDSALLRFCGEYMHGGQTQADGQRILKLVKRALAGELKTQKPHEKRLLDQNFAPYSMVMRASKLDKRRFDDAIAHLEGLTELLSGSGQSGHPNGRTETARWLSLGA